MTESLFRFPKKYGPPRRRVTVNFVRWGWYMDIPVPFMRVWLICDVGRSWDFGWRRDV